ncbi:hypothetical protein [Haliscomenobacter sp.]|uniref:hypothetical protein n=1 Tax=Haliscomenobacter sp. TaxID=2717303 RepID=UPI003364C5A8
MKKYVHVQDVVVRLTDNKTFRTFFTLYLMAETVEERQVLNDRFWRDANTLHFAEMQLLKAEFTRCFLRLPGMATDLLGQISAKAA